MKNLIALLAILISSGAFAQKKDTTGLYRKGFICQFTYSFQVPGGDLAKRYGNNHAVGSGVYYKMKNNWLFGVEGNYIFGNSIREKDIFKNITDADGYAVDQNGSLVPVQAEERGFTMMAKLGKIIPLGRRNVNSGLMISVGMGYMQHYLRLKNNTSGIPALQGDYAYGYDRFCAGYAFNQFIGYQNLDKRNRINFFAGIEFYQAYTTSQRTWDYDLRSYNPRQRLDLQFGLRFGWLLPIYTQSGSKSYSF